MKREIYVWIAVFAIIFVAALYWKYLYAPQLSISLEAQNLSNSTFYPYQRVSLPVTVSDTGQSPIENMSIGLYKNDNLTLLYKVTLPAGKQTTVYYNFSPTAPGAYSFSFIADPGKLYNIANRAQAETKYNITVLSPQNASEYENVSPENTIYYGTYSFGPAGLPYALYLDEQYAIAPTALSQMTDFNSFLYPLLNLTSTYIENTSATYAVYPHSSEAAIWLLGYLSPGTIGVAAQGAGYNVSYVENGSKNFTLVRLSNTTTVCSTYSRGWLKLFAYHGNETCVSALSQQRGEPAYAQNLSDLNSTITARNKTIGRVAYTVGTKTSIGTLSVLNNSILLSSITKGEVSPNSTCLGIISAVGNVSFCSRYILNVSQLTSNSPKLTNEFALIRTTAYIGNENASVFSLVNGSQILNQVQNNINTIKKFNLTGKSMQFTLLTNSCQFNSAFSCANATYLNGTLSVTLTNLLNSSVKIDSFGCYRYPPLVNLPVGHTVAKNAKINVQTYCYSLDKPLNGIAYNLHLNLAMNYTVGNVVNSTEGSAYIQLG